MSHQATLPEVAVAAFSFNKNLHQAKLDWRFNEQFTDPGWATAYIGAELLAQQERAARRYDRQASALRTSVDDQTRQNAERARILQTTIKESSDAVRRELSTVTTAVEETTAAVYGLASQVAQLAWLQAEQNTTLRHVLETIRESRANECRQLVEQGERNFQAGFLGEAEERFRLALGFDNTDYPTRQHLGLTLVRLGRMDEALDHFKKALAFPPKQEGQAAFFVARAATHAARVLYAMEDYAGAETYLQRALDADAMNAKNWYDLAVVRTYQRNTRGALDALTHAFDSDVLFAGSALADEELAAIRPAIEDLVIEHTEGAFARTVENSAEVFRAARTRIAEMARDLGVTIDLGPDPDGIVRDARSRGTLTATQEAFETLRREHSELMLRARHAIRTARVAAQQTIERDCHARRIARDDEHAEMTKRIDALSAAAHGGASDLARVASFVIGAVIGAIVGGKATGFGGLLFGIGIGGAAGLLAHALIHRGAQAASQAELDRLRAEARQIDEEATQEEAHLTEEEAARLKEIEAYEDELARMNIS